MIKLIFKHIKKLIKYFFINFCLLYKNDKNKNNIKNTIKNTKKDSKKKLMKEIKISLRHNKNLSEEQNQKLVEYRRKYYLTHNK